MLRYIKKYPVSFFIIAVVIYLSFFKPPSDTGLNDIPYLDKIVHFGMYFGLSGMLWLEFLRNHKNNDAPMWHAWIGACLCPILFSGIVELFQEIATDYRGGDWMDFAANTSGAVVASLLAYYWLRPRFHKIKVLNKW
ncbi:VanZ family protein [Bacteroides sp. 519]|uniref:VanZ family protein n=1 Tax=Bacteroides sp. 519 TaxID=2302937 RepID=UPI0013CFF301|nr:VanZ family protein [Bacteroides sp. 519]NDV57283.1 VanZ family protein [Bacteroides sp. 519]